MKNPLTSEDPKQGSAEDRRWKNYKGFAGLVKEGCRLTKLSREQLANKADIARSNLSMFLNGRRRPSAEAVLRLAKELYSDSKLYSGSKLYSDCKRSQDYVNKLLRAAECPVELSLAATIPVLDLMRKKGTLTAGWVDCDPFAMKRALRLGASQSTSQRSS